MYQGVLAQILSDSPARTEGDPVIAAAITLRAGVAELPALTVAERRLFAEWLDAMLAGDRRRSARDASRVPLASTEF
jgi:hypothetical protein